MSAGVTFKDILEVGVYVGGQVELFPNKASWKKLFVSIKGSPNISFFQGILDYCWVVARVQHIPIGGFVTSAFTHAFFQ